jgi:arylsulfatase A-like enzyme
MGALALGSCARREQEPAARHLLLVTLDTTRADRIGCYGRSNAGTPRLDSIASSGVRFARAYAVAPLTLPSHMSILTGLLPPRTGVHANGQTESQAGLSTLAEILNAHGFWTVAAVGGYPVSSRFPVRRGFDSFDDRFLDASNADALERDAGEVVRAALRDASSRNGRRLFLWVHLYDAHDPYAPPSPYRERYAADPYQGEIARMDAALVELMNGLEEVLRKGPLLVCVLGDHGEGLGEHGEDTHGFFLYESTVRVPWVLAGPRVPRGSVVAEPVSTVDVLPTLLGLLDLPVPAGLDGISLDFAPSVPHPARKLYLETELPLRAYGFSPLRAVIEGPLKYIEAPRPELYDVARDGAEMNDLSSDRLEEAAGLRAWVRRSAGSASADDSSVTSDPRLQSLGYVGTSSRVPAHGSLVDPKDRVELYQRFTRASRALERGQPGEALLLLEPLRGESDSDAVRFKRAVAFRMEGHVDRAAEELRRVDAPVPGLHLERARIAVARQQWSVALTEADAQLHEDPAGSEARMLRGAAREFLGDLRNAEVDYREALERNPAYGAPSLRLAALLVRGGRIEEAKGLLRKHLALHPGDTLAQGLLASL